MKDDHNDEDDLDDDDDEDEEVDDDDDDVNIHVSFKDTSLELDDEEDEDDEDDTEDIDNDELLLNVDANRDGGAASASETFPPSDSILKKDASRSSSGSGKSVKGSVTFALDVLQDDDYDEKRERDQQQQQQRTTTQLLDKISRLQTSLREAQIKCETERQRSKKKGKNLVKLAKELKKRQHQKERDADRLEELEEKKKYLEHHWVLAQKELDQEKVLRSKIEAETNRELDRAIEEERARYTKAVAEHERLISDMQRSHQAQCDELSQEILKATLEADRLCQELAAKGVHVPRRVMFNDIGDRGTAKTKNSSNDDDKHSSTSSIAPLALVVCVALTTSLLGAGVWHGLSVGMFTKGGMCSPIRPGLLLTHDFQQDQTFVAPWWTPAPYKLSTFNRFCTTVDADNDSVNNFNVVREPTSLQWTTNGDRKSSHNHRLVLTVDGKNKLTRSSLSKITVVEGNTIRLWKRNGHAEDQTLLW